MTTVLSPLLHLSWSCGGAEELHLPWKLAVLQVTSASMIPPPRPRSEPLPPALNARFKPDPTKDVWQQNERNTHRSFSDATNTNQNQQRGVTINSTATFQANTQQSA
jgi:hypothetical protein